MIPGIVNRNPFNIKNENPADPWEGSIGVDEKGHCIFVDPIYAVRAACRDAARKITHGKNTFRMFFAAYAPAADGNKPLGYAAFIASRLRHHFSGLTMDTPLTLFDTEGQVIDRFQLALFLSAMAEMELFNGYELETSALASGIALYEHDFCR